MCVCVHRYLILFNFMNCANVWSGNRVKHAIETVFEYTTSARNK